MTCSCSFGKPRLTDDILIDTFYDKVLDSLDEPGSFLILLIHGLYDIPGKSTDGNEMFDAFRGGLQLRVMLCLPGKADKGRSLLQCLRGHRSEPDP